MKIVGLCIWLRREQHTKTFPFLHKNDKFEERKGINNGVLTKEDRHGGWEATVVMKVSGEMKVVLTTCTQEELRFLEFTWDFPITSMDLTYHSGCLSGNSVHSPSIGDAFKLLLNDCLYFSR